MELTRKQVIEVLDLIKKQYHPFNINQQRLICALDYAISSLKTDEAYQLMYEGRELFTKDEVIAMFAELQSQMANQENPYGFSDSGHGGWQRRNRECQDLVQEKINALRGEK